MARLKGNEIFLISLKNEREVLIPLLHYYNEVNRAHIGDNITTQEKQKEFLAACKKAKVSLTAARHLARKALAKKWYCFYTVEKYTQKDENGEYLKPDKPTDFFSIITSDDPNTPRRLTEEELIAFDDLNRKSDNNPSVAKFWKQARPILHVPEDYVLVRLSELEILLAVLSEETQEAPIQLEQGYLAPVPSRVATPSTKLTEKLFTPEHIEFLPTEQNQYTIEENGQITLFQQSKNEIAELHAQVMSILFAVFINQFKNEEEEEEEEEGEEENEGQKTEPQTISFYAPDFCKKAGIDPREYSAKRDKTKSIKELRWQAIYKRLKPLETVMGRSIDGVWYRILTIESYDKDREIIKVRTPYLANIYKFLAVRTLEEKRSQVNMLFSSTVVNEPNGAAFELANYLLNQLLQLGNYSKSGNGVVKYTTRYSTLISNCPQLHRALNKIQEKGNPATRAQAYNAKLKQTFEAAYKIIYTKSDAQDYFIDFQINGVKSWKTTMQNGRKIPPNFRIPTKTQINDKLTISHKGKNPDYHRPEK